MTDRLKTEGESPRDTARTINQILDGRINSVGSVTLTASTTTTVIADPRAHVNSKVLLMPTSANAAAALATTWIAAAARSVTVNHASATSTDRSFGYVLLG
ncbi:MAG: hypothetical protein WC869_11665 [Phycisphaerae bacterium]|jgi:hypothetical protein